MKGIVECFYYQKKLEKNNLLGTHNQTFINLNTGFKLTNYYSKFSISI